MPVTTPLLRLHSTFADYVKSKNRHSSLILFIFSLSRFLAFSLSRSLCRCGTSFQARSKRTSRLIARDHFDISFSLRRGHTADVHLLQILRSFMLEYTSTSRARSLPHSRPSQFQASKFEFVRLPTLQLDSSPVSHRPPSNIFVIQLALRSVTARNASTAKVFRISFDIYSQSISLFFLLLAAPLSLFLSPSLPFFSTAMPPPILPLLPNNLEFSPLPASDRIQQFLSNLPAAPSSSSSSRPVPPRLDQHQLSTLRDFLRLFRIDSRRTSFSTSLLIRFRKWNGIAERRLWSSV